MTSRYDAMFERLEAKGELAWIPFIMLGYPSLQQSLDDIQTLIDSGADALELGIPFSDPVADGLHHGSTRRREPHLRRDP